MMIEVRVIHTASQSFQSKSSLHSFSILLFAGMIVVSEEAFTLSLEKGSVVGGAKTAEFMSDFPRWYGYVQSPNQNATSNDRNDLKLVLSWTVSSILLDFVSWSKLIS